MTAEQAYALGIRDARPLSQDAADNVAAILARWRPAACEPQAA